MTIATTIKAMRAAGIPDSTILEAVVEMDQQRRRQGPRSAAREQREAVLERDGFACVYCGEAEGPLHCDHVIPYSRGGWTSLDNLVTACRRCNISKKDRTPDEWRRR